MAIKITLRKANAIQQNINDLLKNIQVKATVELNEFQDVVQSLQAANDAVMAADVRRSDLLMALYSIRATVGVANFQCGLGNRLSHLAYIDKRLHQLEGLVAESAKLKDLVVLTRRKKIPQEVFVQSTATPRPVICAATLNAIGPVALTEPTSPLVLIQSCNSSLHVAGRAPATGAMHCCIYIPPLVVNFVKPPLTVAPAGSRFVSGPLWKTNVSALALGAAKTGIASASTEIKVITFFISISFS